MVVPSEGSEYPCERTRGQDGALADVALADGVLAVSDGRGCEPRATVPADGANGKGSDATARFAAVDYGSLSR